jgi:hypothetical protein
MKKQSKYYQLAVKYAPVFAQKVSEEWWVADQIAPIDFADGITDVAKNPDELDKITKQMKDKTIEGAKQVKPAKVYYSVCETATHYFLLYAVYHVMDWWKRSKPQDIYNYIRDKYDEHIHDMEGVLLVLTKRLIKDPERRKEKLEIHLDGLVTVAHSHFYLYTEPMIPTGVGKAQRAPQAKTQKNEKLRIVSFNETVDGKIWLDKTTGRVKLYVEARGHGIRGDHEHWGGGDKIWYYYPKQETAIPGTLDPKEKKNTKPVKYQLENTFADNGLWDKRFDDRVFKQNDRGQWGFVYKNKEDGKLYSGAANPPWSWNDCNDPSPIGEIATDPARFIIRYAQGWGPVSTHYIYNPYQSIIPSS